MSETFEKASDLVTPHLKEAVKTYSVYDGSNRLTQFYTAATDAQNGQSCMLTTYEYVGLTSRIAKTKESLATWDSTWDI